MVLSVGIEFPAYGEMRVAHELRKRVTGVSLDVARCVWIRRSSQSFRLRLRPLEEMAAKDGKVLTEAQVAALE